MYEYLCNDGRFGIVANKGFYIRKSKLDDSLHLNVFVSDFKAFLEGIPQSDGWVRLRIFERHKVDEKGFTHNMEAIMPKVEKVFEK